MTLKISVLLFDSLHKQFSLLVLKNIYILIFKIVLIFDCKYIVMIRFQLKYN
jgi:hypothetical protein